MEQQTKVKEVKKNYKQLYINEKQKKDNLEKENQYLLAKINILTNNQNKGEKDEVLLLIKLFHFNQTNQYDKQIIIDYYKLDF